MSVNYFSTEHLVVYVFLAITLIIGLWAGKNIKDIKDYALANKKYGLGTITIIFLATYLNGGSVIESQKSILNEGIIVGIVILSYLISFVLTGIFIIPKLTYFKDAITVGDVMGNLYGKYGSLITSALGVVYTIFLVGAQILAVGYVCNELLGWPPNTSIVIGGIILILYTSVGGIKAIASTDILQFIAAAIVLPTIAHIAVSEAGGIVNVIKSVPQDKLSILTHSKLPRYLVIPLLISVIFPSPIVYPPLFQIMLMTDKPQKSSKVLFISAAFMSAVKILIILTTLAVLAIYPKIKAAPGAASFYIINNYLSPVFRGIAISGYLAIVISTVNAYLNAGAILFTRNFIKQLYLKESEKFNELLSVRVITFLIGAISILAALSYKNIQNLSYLGMGILAPVISFPLIVGILGLKSDHISFISSFIATTSTFILCYLFIKPTYLTFPISFVASVVSFLTIHYIKNKGLVLMDRTTTKGAVLFNRVKLKSIYLAIKNLAYLPNSINEYTTKGGEDPVTFGLFISFMFMVPFLTSYRIAHANTYKWILVIKSIGILFCLGLLFKPDWPDRFKKYYPIYWNITLLYCLPFVSGLLFIIHEYNIVWVINISLCIILLITLVGWKPFFSLSIIGFLLAIFFYKLAIGPIPKMDNIISYELIYGIIFAIIIGFIFIRKQEKTTEDKIRLSENKVKISEVVASATSHEVTDELNEAFAAAQTIDIMRRQGNFRYAKINDEEGYFINNKLYDKIIKLYPAVHEAANRIKITTLMFRNAIKGFDLALDNEKLSIKEIINEALKGLYLTEGRKNKLHLDLNADFNFIGDRRMFKHVIWNLLKNTYKHSGTEEVFIWLENDSKKEYNEVHIKDHGIGIKPENLHKIFELFFTTGNSENSTGIGLSLCKTIIEKLGGNIRCESKQGEGSYTEFIISLPKI
jgi:Na+/proline symporter/signal transduction histidine kinase